MESEALAGAASRASRGSGSRPGGDRLRRARRSAGQLLRFGLRGVTVRFGAIRALSEVSIDFRPGEIHAVLGENGAGKSTLANVLDRRIVPESGEAVVDGTVGHVHQHFAIPPGLTAAECLVVEESGFRPLAPRRLAERFRRVETETGIALGDPGAEAVRLPVGARQRLELARALARRPDLLLLDEPTAVLAPAEIEAFSESVRSVARRGAAVVFITHKLPETFAISDRITLLRRGERIFTKAVADTSAAEIASLFLAGAPPTPRTRREPGAAVLVLDRVSTASSAGGSGLDDVSLVVREGEIAAVVGVDGNGQDALAEVVSGLRAPSAGSVRVGNAPVAAGGFRRGGSSVVPGDRQREGLILDFSIADNLRLAEPIPDADEASAERAIAANRIVASSSRQPARALSGGNQQKLILARELGREPRFLLAVSPTRGLDLAASRATLASLDAAANRRGSVLLVTSDLDDARSVADAIHVLYRGRLSSPLPPDTPLDRIGRAMAGLVI